MRSVRRRTTGLAVAGLLIPLVAAPAFTAGVGPAAGPPADVDCDAVVATPDRETAFAAASKATGVPADLLKAVAWMESRWDQHAGAPSADGGYGVFNLADHAPGPPDGAGKGEETSRESVSEIDRAAALTGLSADRLKVDAGANVCAGGALLAGYQADAGRGTDAPLEDWDTAVARLSEVPTFADRVLTTLRQGQQRTTDDGGTVTLEARPDVATTRTTSAAGDPAADCPRRLGCEWLPAPYEKTDPDEPDDTGSYGNHDQADRTGDGGPSIDYIVVHDTETEYEPTVRLVQDPTYLAWNYTLRSSDGHVANHLEAADVGWHAGNWYMNMHSIGIEHEGWAGTAGWFTEAMYQTSAELVRHLAEKYDVPLDRAHVVGHDQIPGILPGATKDVHWDPGPYWDWDHYMELLGAPVGGGLDPATDVEADVEAGDVVEVVAGYDGNDNPVTGCEEASPGSGDCVEGAATNFVLAHQEPSLDAPYARDPGWKPDGEDGTTHASDISARVNSGHKLAVAQVEGDWLGVWWAGSLAWIHNPASRPVVVPSTGQTVTVSGDEAAAVYGRAYPEAEAYEAHPDVPVQEVTPIEYTIGVDQTYVVADDDVPTDYYRAVSFDGSAPGDRTDLRGEDEYYQLWYAHRHVFARAAELTLHDPVVTDVEGPRVEGKAKIGKVLRADVGEYLPETRHLRTEVRWLRDGEPVRGAHGPRYHLTGRDRGAEIAVEVTVSARGHEAGTFVSDPVGPVSPR